jgi:hypothetical protein
MVAECRYSLGLGPRGINDLFRLFLKWPIRFGAAALVVGLQARRFEVVKMYSFLKNSGGASLKG